MMNSIVFDGKYTSSKDKIFRINGDKYYYRNNVYDKFFKYNIESFLKNKMLYMNML